MIWFRRLSDTFLLEKVSSFVFFSNLTIIIFFILVLISVKLFMYQVWSILITTIIQPTFICVYIFSHFSIRRVYILHIFIFHAKVIFSGFLSCISQLFTVFWKFLSCIVLFFHKILYCIPVLLKRNCCGRPEIMNYQFSRPIEFRVFYQNWTYQIILCFKNHG